MMKLLLVLAIAILQMSSPNGYQGLPRSPLPPAGNRLVQVWGGNCQTQYGVCPLLDPDGNRTQAPVGAPCFCGQDPGQVVE